MISSGVYAPGSLLPSAKELAALHGCSEAVIQNVLSGLSISGLIQPLAGAGYIVSEPASDPIKGIRKALHVLELRYALEQETAALAAQRRTDADLRNLRAALLHLQSIDPEAFEDFAKADLNLHLAITIASGNPLFVEVMAPLFQDAVQDLSLRQKQVRSSTRLSFLRRAHGEHGRIVDAIAREDAGDARRQMKRHFQLPLRRYRALLGLQPDQSD